MLLRLSHFKLNSYVILVVSKRKGITLVVFLVSGYTYSASNLLALSPTVVHTQYRVHLYQAQPVDFSSFSHLFTRNMGLADLAEEPGEDKSLEGEEEQGSFDVVDWEDSAPEYSAPPTIIEESVTEYEMLPAVGGGTITRRVYTIPNP
ncbi:hypothetical protein F4604DRAFT_1920509 [Suillus subluteus]|nr:hypothetical protein F4604DRAFT_1920509 [Suillus subluteus]